MSNVIFFKKNENYFHSNLFAKTTLNLSVLLLTCKLFWALFRQAIAFANDAFIRICHLRNNF